MRKSKLAPMVPYVKHYNVTYGWYLFPARVDKKSSWLRKKDAPEHFNWGMTADPVRLEQNFSAPGYCDKCGIGLPTGEINGIFIVECDTKQGHGVDGIASMEVLVEKHGLLPKTLMARSPSGSLHFYFNHPGVKVWSSASKLGPGIDVRGDGGMVVAPPSERKDGVYAWHNDEEIADAPDWLIELVTVSTAGARTSATERVAYATGDVDPYLELAREQITEPINVDELLDDLEYGRNVHDTEVKLTASLLASGEPVDVVIETVLDEVRTRIEAEGLKWDWKAEQRKLRDMCASWLRKKPDVLELQESIPPWLAKKLNGALHTEAPPKPEASPVPEPSKPQLPWPVMGNDAFHGLAGEAVRLFEGNTEGDSNAILIQFLTYFGNMVGRGHYYQVEGDRHHANLFSVIVGDTSSGRKGISAGRVRQLMHAVDKINNGDWFEKCIKGGLSSGEGLINEIRDDATTIDPATGNVVYGMARDKRRLFDEREFSRILAVMKRDANTLSHIVRDAWDGRTLSTLVKNNPAIAREPHVSISAHVTPDELRRDLDSISMANGYANRFLYGCARRPIKLPFGGVVDLNAIETLAGKISAQFFKAFQTEKAVALDAKARDLWARVYAELSEGKPGLVGAIVARGEAQVMRLALIYALLDGSDEIRLPHLKAGIAVWEYCEDSARYIFGDSLGDNVADQILQALRQVGKTGMTRTDIYNMFGRNVSASRIATALLLLAKYGLAMRTQKATRGRPVETYFCS